MTGIKL